MTQDVYVEIAMFISLITTERNITTRKFKAKQKTSLF